MSRESGDRHTKRRRNEAFGTEIEALIAFYAQDVVCYPAPGWIDGDTVCHGHDGFRRLASVWSDDNDDVALQVHDVRDMHDRVLVLAEFTGRSRDTGGVVHQLFGVVNSKPREDGRFGEVRFYLTWQQAQEAVGLAE
jgi:hypothetical protein